MLSVKTQDSWYLPNDRGTGAEVEAVLDEAVAQSE